MNERDYIRGKNAAYANVLIHAAAELGTEDSAAAGALLLAERIEARAALNGLCGELGIEAPPAARGGRSFEAGPHGFESDAVR